MSRRMTRIALASACLAALSVTSRGLDDPKRPEGPNTAPPGAQKPKVDAKAKGVADLRLAADLVAYGRQSRSPESLILAAKILASTPVKPDGGTAKLVGGSAKPDPATPDADAPDPAKLLAEARAMGGDEHVVAMIAEAAKIIAERSKGEFDGAAVRNGYVGPNGFANWTAVFRAGELASVTIAGSGGADFDLYVTDDRGNQICADTGPTANATCTWYPSYTATFHFRVVNCSPFGSGYRFINN